MYQVSDVARLFGVSDTTIRNWVKKKIEMQTPT